MAKVDMTRDANLPLRQRFGIRGYPALKMFKAHNELPFEYRGPQHAVGIAEYLLTERSLCADCGPQLG